jgi:hypothetical protein
MPASADKHLEVLLEVRDLLGEIRDRLPKPPLVSEMAVEPPTMATADKPAQTAPDPAGPPVRTDTEGDGDGDK